MDKLVDKRRTRAEIPIKETWNLSDLFASSADFDQALVELNLLLPDFKPFMGRVCENKDVLLSCLNKREELSLKLIKVSTYASLKQSEDGTDPVNQANSSKLSALVAKIHATLSFIDSELIELDHERLNEWMIAQPKLTPYKQTILDLFRTKPYRLTTETEKVLASLSDVHNAPYTIYETSKAADMRFTPFSDDLGNEYPNSFSLYEDRYEFSPNAIIRQRAYQSFVETLSQYKNTYASVYATEIKTQVQIAKLRGYDSVIDMLLQPQKVEKQMYENQLNIIQKELAPHMRRFAAIKKRVLGLDNLHFYDLKAPLDSEFQPQTTFKDASNLILEALQVMGDEYGDIMKRALSERWVDFADNIGKSTGAFCSSPYGVHPYILITWTDTMRGAFVLAHELGHAGHFYLANKNQRIMGTRPSMYFIEAPSTMNELLLGEYLLSRTNDKNMKRWVIIQLLGTYYHNFVTHLLEGEFQRRVYQLAEIGVPLTADVLSEQKLSILSEFWGDTVKLDEAAGLTWMRQPHYYMGLYPYTYSAGLTASTAVVEQMKVEGKPAVNRWIEVLKAGGTLSPVDLLKKAGIDMTTSEPIEKAVAYVGKLVDELEKSF